MGIKQEGVLPYWAVVAFIARCARRYADCFGENSAEPAASRVAVDEAVRLAEERASLGGDRYCDGGYLEFDGKFFDNYDIRAINEALGSYSVAARNTLVDLSEDPEMEPVSRRNLTALCLASLALEAAFPDELSASDLLDQNEAIGWVVFGDPALSSCIEADLLHAECLAKGQGWIDETGISPAVFGTLWPQGRPSSWCV